MFRAFFLLLFGLITFSTHPSLARETAVTKETRAYALCVHHTIQDKILGMAKDGTPGFADRVKALANDKDPLYADCQALPGNNDIIFRIAYCENVSTVNAILSVNDDKPVLAFVQKLGMKEHSPNDPWRETSSCLLAAPASTLTSIDTFAQDCSQQIRQNLKGIQGMAHHDGLSDEDLAKVINEHIKRAYQTRLCMRDDGLFN